VAFAHCFGPADHARPTVLTKLGLRAPPEALRMGAWVGASVHFSLVLSARWVWHIRDHQCQIKPKTKSTPAPTNQPPQPTCFSRLISPRSPVLSSSINKTSPEPLKMADLPDAYECQVFSSIVTAYSVEGSRCGARTKTSEEMNEHYWCAHPHLMKNGMCKRIFTL